MKKIVCSEDVPKAIGPYSQGVGVEKFLFLSGQLPISLKEGKIVEESIEGQTRQSLENIKTILESEGYGLRDIIKTTVYLKDIRDFPKMNEVYAEYFSGENYPARSAFQVSCLPQDALVEIETIAYKDM